MQFTALGGSDLGAIQQTVTTITAIAPKLVPLETYTHTVKQYPYGVAPTVGDCRGTVI